MEDIQRRGKPPAIESHVGELGAQDDCKQVAQHGDSPEGEALAVLLAVQREFQDGRQADQTFPTEESQQKGDDEASQTAVGVGAGQEEDAGELWEEYDVHEVRAHDVEAVHAPG